MENNINSISKMNVENKYKDLINENDLLKMVNRYIQLEKEFNEYKEEFKYCVKDMEYCFKDARAGEDGEAKYFTFDDYINRFKK